MEILVANSSKAQMKIQQMAFVLVALAIFFALAALLYFSFSLYNLRDTANTLADDEAREIVRKLSGAPELGFTSSTDCNSCIDLDKALLLKELAAAGSPYENFWNLDYLMVEKISNSGNQEECTRFNYPNCKTITIINKNANFGSASKSFVALATWDEGAKRYRYEFGRIHASGGKLNVQN